jgi:hypothetical protein
MCINYVDAWVETEEKAYVAPPPSKPQSFSYEKTSYASAANSG